MHLSARSSLLSVVCLLSPLASAQPLSITTLAGLPPFSGTADGTGPSARFNAPAGLAADSAGNLYLADAHNDAIRKISPNGQVSTLAGLAGVGGDTDGIGGAARFLGPSGVAVDATGNVYVADTDNCTIRKISPDGAVTTVAGTALSAGSADGSGSAARFNYPWGIAVDGAGNLYVADWGNSTIRKISPAGVVSTVAGAAGTTGAADGTGGDARFNFPAGIAVDPQGNLYVADSGNDTVRTISPEGVVATLAGLAVTPGSVDGSGTAARFETPLGLALDGSGNVYLADSGNDALRMITPSGVVSTLAGTAGISGTSDGAGAAARFAYPEGVAADSSGNIYAADTGNETVRAGIFGSTGQMPLIQAQPTGALVAPGQSVALSVKASGGSELTYQWYRNGSAIAGATAATLMFPSAQSGNDGDYSVVVSNATAAVTSALADLTVAVPPTIVAAPASQTVSAGASLTLSVTATNATNYQWTFNGQILAGATNSTLPLSNLGADQAGVYSVLVSNPQSSVVAPGATISVVTAAHLVNLSSRANVGASSLYAGFVIEGAAAKQVVLRGVGPGLSAYGVPGALSQPQLQLFDSGATAAAASDAGWGASSSMSQAFVRVGAFPLAAGSADSVLMQSLPAGAYTAVVSGVGGATGVALAEIYDADTGAPSSHLIELSSRALAGTGANALTAGFVIAGTTSETILIRGVGPSLQQFGVSGTLANPVLTVYDSAGSTIAAVTGWSGARVSAAFAATGAFPLTNPADCALVLTLPPGAYSAVVSGVNQTTGVALVEVYDLP